MATIYHNVVRNFHKEQTWEPCSSVFVSPLTSLEWAPTSSHAALGHLDGAVTVCRINGDIQETQSVNVSNTRISSVSFNETSDLFACTSADDKNIYLTNFDQTMGTLDADILPLEQSDCPRFVSFMEDVTHGQNILIVGSPIGMRLIDVESGAVFREMLFKGGATSIRSWNGCMMAVGAVDRSVQIWDVRVRTPVAIYKPKTTSQKLSFDIDNNHRILVIGGEAGAVHLFDLTSKKEVAKRKIHTQPIKALRFSQQMRFLLTTDGEKIALTNLNEPAHAHTVDLAENAGVTGIRWHPEKCSFLTRDTSKNLVHRDYIVPKETIQQ